MATDPNMTEEQKRRQRGLGRMSFGASGSAAAFAPAAAAAAAPVVAPAVTAVGLTRRPAPAEAPAPAAPQVQLIDPEAASLDNADDRRAAGLTRVFKSRDAQGNSVYSNVGEAPAGAETRYYGAMGNRADVTGRVTPRSANDFYGADEALDLSTAAGRSAVFGNAANQRRGLGRQLVDNQANDQDFQWVPDPNTGRNTVMSREQREFVNPQLAAARARGTGAPDFGDQIALARLQLDQANRAEDREIRQQGETRQQIQDMRNFSRAEDGSIDPAFLREELGRLRGAGPEQIDAFFETDQGRYLQSILNYQLAQSYEGNAAALGGGAFLDTPRNFGDLQPARGLGGIFGGGAVGGRFTTPKDSFQHGVTAEDLGLQDADLEQLMQYYARRNAQNR